MASDGRVSGDESHVVTEAAMEKTVNTSTVLRYPFQIMELGWLIEYIDTCLSKEERWAAAMRIINCLMAFALINEDPFLEQAAFQFYDTVTEKSNKKIWPKRTHDVNVTFEAAYSAFETACVIGKCPHLDSRKRVALLKVREGVIKKIEKSLDNTSINADTTRSKDILNASLSSMQALRQSPDSSLAFDAVMESLKSLFFSFIPCLGLYSMMHGSGTKNNIYVCNERCPCLAKLQTTYTLFIRGVEKTKIIDCLLMMAVKEDDDLVTKIVEELFTRFDCRIPLLEKPIRRIHNGTFFIVRMALFDAFHRVKILLAHLRASPVTLIPLMDNIILTLSITRREMKGIKGLSDHLSLVDRALATADSIYSKLGTDKSYQGLNALKEEINRIFDLLSASEFHLASHSRDPLVGKGANLMCGNPNCPGKVKEMLKCSGCRVTFYCNVECQREDWKTHRLLCNEMRSRKIAPTPIEVVECPVQTIKAAALV
ncbi:zinc finger protein [Trypanosoma melophagium]|uniref:zinc finger protein n=1 Tax=Trypanosoma melophagium TaxID=715481 RepID=UPI00351A67F1|nr:zinc finger protein [Trypanosoma melophagium]